MTDERLKKVREQADSLGIKYHHRAGAAKIMFQIQDYLDQQEADNATQESISVPNPPGTPGINAGLDPLTMPKVIPMTTAEYREKKLLEDKKKVGQLIRVKIQCMNPAKKDWPGEIVSVGSAKLGTFKKYIPFGSGEPYHIPKIIYDVLREKKCSIFYNAKDAKGHKTRRSRLANEYAIEVLEPLSKQELSKLAKQQALAAGQG